MSKFLYLSDSHIRGVNSCNRKGSYYSDIMEKYDEILSIAKARKCDFIIDGGDTFDSHTVANTMVDDFVDKIENNKIPYYVVWGNHTERNDSLELSKGTTLDHIFRRSKLINSLDTIEDDYSIIQGFHYFHRIAENLKENGLSCKKNTKKTRIAIVHAMITLKPILEVISHVLAKDLEPDFDYVFVAHNHSPWGIKEIEGNTFINVGCLGRRKIDEADIKPSIVFMDTKIKELEIIPLKSAKAKEKCFDLTKVEIKKEFEADLTNFIESLKGTKIETIDLKDVTEYIAKEKGIEREVIDCVIEKIGRFKSE